jgi:hypothetical protein
LFPSPTPSTSQAGSGTCRTSSSTLGQATLSRRYVPCSLPLHGYFYAHLTSGPQSVKDAKAYYNNKILSLRKNLDDLQPVINKKQENRETVVAVLQVKLAERDKQQAQEKGRS